MKGVVFLGDRKLELREFPDPIPGPRDVVLEIKASRMCGSDLHTYRAPAQPGGAVAGGIKRQAGVIAGHEPCGVVAAVGAGVSEKEFRSLPVIPSSMPILIKFRHCCCRPPGLSPRRRAALGRVRPSLPPR